MDKKTKLEILKYKRMLEARRGYNFEYWTEKHDRMLENGWDLLEFCKTPTRQWNKLFKQYATSSVFHAKQEVERLRSEGFFARIVCGYEQNVQRVKMHSVIFKKK